MRGAADDGALFALMVDHDPNHWSKPPVSIMTASAPGLPLWAWPLRV